MTSLPSWIYCFLAYIAIRANDQGVRDILAYARLMVREAQKHGGSGWLDYDRVFCQQAALDPSLRWNMLHPSGSNTGWPHCRLNPSLQHMQGTRPYCRAVCPLLPPASYWDSNAPGLSVWPPGPRAPLRRQPKSMMNICVSWNKGHCAFTGTCRLRYMPAAPYGERLCSNSCSLGVQSWR